jgi:predicted Zn-ribbon and HTH transcriptional regulator
MVNRHHVSDILARFIPAYKQQHGVSYQQAKSCQHIMDCQTARLGSQQWQCNNCGYEQLHYCSCRDSHCPRRQGKKRQQWVESQQSQVIHLVFTLPYELNVITEYAQTALYRALFQAVWQTLDKFAHNRNAPTGNWGSLWCFIHGDKP